MHAPTFAHSQQVVQSSGGTSQPGAAVVDDIEAPAVLELESAAAVLVDEVEAAVVLSPPPSPFPQPNRRHPKASRRIAACYLAPLADSR